MNEVLVIGLVITVGMGVALIAHVWTTRQILPILNRFATELDGVVERPSFFLSPKLVFRHHDASVDVSTASSSTKSNGGRYTYALFSGLTFDGFSFRIVPKSVQTIVDETLGLEQRMDVENPELERHFSVYTNDESRMRLILHPQLERDLLRWASQDEPQISSIRNDDDQLIYSVRGGLREDAQFKDLIDRSTRFYDALDEALSSARVLPGAL